MYITCIQHLNLSQNLLVGMKGWNKWSSALKIHELYNHSLVMVSKPYLQHGFNHHGPLRENMLKLINMDYLNNILSITHSKSLYIILLNFKNI